MRTVYSFRNLLQHRAICKSDGIAVEIDRVVVGKAADRAVTGQIPDASGIDRNNGIVAIRFSGGVPFESDGAFWSPD